MKYRFAKIEDLDDIMKIEHASFNVAEAGSESAYDDRISKLKDTFLLAQNDDDKIVGFIVGPAVKDRYITDKMFNKTPKNLMLGGHQLVFSIAIDPDFRGQGIGSELLKKFEENAQKSHRETISLTCLADRIPFYEKNGYIDKGISESKHGNETWHNMEKSL